MGQMQNSEPSLKGVLIVLAVGMAIACVISNAAGKRDGCEHRGGEQVGLECVMPTPTP